MRRPAVGLAAIVVAIMAAVGPASAGGLDTVKTTVTIKDDCKGPGPGGKPFQCRTAARAARRNYVVDFSGRVKSEVDACRRGRTVKLQRTYTGPPPRRGVETLETTTSSARGKWKVRLTKIQAGEGIYRVSVTRERKNNVVCKAAQTTEEHDLIL